MQGRQVLDGELGVDVRGLHKAYGGVPAVDGIDLQVARGRTLALLGPNGAGKTTTIECCVGLRSPDAGTVRVLGLDPRADAPAVRPRIGVMLQEGGVYPQSRPVEVLELFAALYADPLDPSTLLSRVGLDAVRSTTCRDLSGGQRQRLSLALAVVGRPQLVFLDEPTAGLDPAARHAAWDHISELRDDGITIVLTTHLLDEAELLADDVVIIDHGCVVAAGTPRELMAGEGEGVSFTAPPGLAVSDLAVAIGHDVDEEAPGTYRITASATPRLLAVVTGWLAERDVTLGHLETGAASLEDVFLRLTSESSAAGDARRARHQRRGARR